MYDVVILGGGPAGCGTALALHQLGIERVLVVEASDYLVPRVGESIPPDTSLLLRRLGILASFEAQGHSRCLGSCSSWGSAELGYNDFLTNAQGEGWHLDRVRFDRWFADQVVDKGIEVRTRTSFAGVQTYPSDGVFDVALVAAGEAVSSVQGRFVVDATGRQARFARRLGSQPRFDDQLVCVAGYFDAGPSHDLTAMTMLEAVEYGWWYAALLPDGRATAAVASDASILNELGLTRSDGWLRALEQTVHVGPALESCTPVDRLQTWAAPSSLLDPPAGAGWLAVGDAASAFDPISSQGIYKALADGLAAAPAIVAWLQGDPTGVVAYRTGLAARFVDFLQIRDHFYNIERRWEQAPFWERRYRRRARIPCR